MSAGDDGTAAERDPDGILIVVEHWGGSIGSMASSWAAAARLVRRTGFGATGATVDAVVKEGAAAYVARVLADDGSADPGAIATPAPQFAAIDPAGKNDNGDERSRVRMEENTQDDSLVAWWLRRMASVHEPFREKATFGWHAHFATSLKKVKDARSMLAQNQRQRALATGKFGDLAYAMLVDAATIRWLDGQKNSDQGPNENLSREFMEIFTLGHADGYTETDVREGARALTGWKLSRRTGQAGLVPARHDTTNKTIFGQTGNFGAQEFCDLVLARPGCAPFVVTKLWNYYVSDAAPPKDVLARLLAAYGAQRNVGALLEVMFTDPSFAAAEGTLTIGPLEWALGAVRTLRVPLGDTASVKLLAASLDSLGQLPLYPPSVGGWPSGPVWLSTAASDIRFGVAAQLVARAPLPAFTGTSTARLEALAHLLGVATWSSGSLAVLKGALSDPKQLVAVALNTPEYLVH